MDIQQEIIDRVIYGGEFDTIRGLILERELTSRTPEKNDFTRGLFWSEGDDLFMVAYSPEVMVMTKNGLLRGVAKYDGSLIPAGSESQFQLSDGSTRLAEGIL